MILRTLLLLLAIMPLSSSLQASLWSNVADLFSARSTQPAPSIRVLLLHGVEGADLEVRGQYSLFDPFTNEYISTRFKGKRKDLQTLNDGLKWGEAFPGLYQLKIRPDEANSMTIVNEQEYLGSLYVYDIGGAISIVNQVPIEQYVYSILSNEEAEIQPLHPEVVASLAIVARTNAYFQAQNPKTSFWSVDAQTVHYRGNPRLKEEGEDVQVIEKIDNAINATRHMIISNTGVYEKVATPFAAEFGFIKLGHHYKDVVVSKISLQEANQLAQNGMHAAQILGKAFPYTTVMLSP